MGPGNFRRGRAGTGSGWNFALSDTVFCYAAVAPFRNTAVKSVRAIFVAILVCLAEPSAFAATCAEPDAPPAPAGASASRDQIDAAIAAFRQYQAGADNFQKCLDDARREKSTDADDIARRSDAAYGRLIAAADRLAAELRAWAAKNGKPIPAS